MVELEVPAAVRGDFAREQSLDDVEGLAQPLVPLHDAGPTNCHDMLVESLARPEAQAESAVRHHT
jgi:hypothetical protein